MPPTPKAKSFDSTDATTTYGNGHPVLPMEEIDHPHTKLTFTGEVTAYTSEFGDGFYFGVVSHNKTWDFRVKETSGNYPRIKALGATARALKGKTALVALREFKGRDYIAIVDEPKPTKKART